MAASRRTAGTGGRRVRALFRCAAGNALGALLRRLETDSARARLVVADVLPSTLVGVVAGVDAGELVRFLGDQSLLPSELVAQAHQLVFQRGRDRLAVERRLLLLELLLAARQVRAVALGGL